MMGAELVCLCPGDCGCHPGNRRPNVCGCRGHVERRPCSANGYSLEVQGVELAASWPAPFFRLELADVEEDEPLLFHCETLEDARRRPGIVLDGSFERVTS